MAEEEALKPEICVVGLSPFQPDIFQPDTRTPVEDI